MLLTILVSLLGFGVTALLAQQDSFDSGELDQPAYRLLKELHEFGRTNSMWNVPPQDGRFLQMLVRMTGAKSVLEVGTSDGVSSIWMALGLRETGGKLVTLEMDHRRAELARENFRKAGVSDQIELIEGDALKVLPTLSGHYNLVFIDAAKEQYKQYLDAIWAHIPTGGVIVAHNAVAMADEMKPYLDFVQTSPELQTVIVQTGQDGMAVSYRNAVK